MSVLLRSLEQLRCRALRGDFYVDASVGAGLTCSLLQPPGMCSAFTRSGSIYPPLGLLTLQATVGNMARACTLEAEGLGLTDEETVSELRKQAPVAVGMTATCGTIPVINAWSTVAHHLFSWKPLTLVGGPATAFEHGRIFKECPHVDVIVRGDGEVTFPSIVDALDATRTLPRQTVLDVLSTMEGVMVRNKPQLNDFSIPRFSKEGFATLPFPDFSQSPVQSYWAPDARRTPMVTMMTQRGCVANCTFCNTPQKDGNEIRGYSNERIVDNLLKLNELGVREVSFVDDVFTNRPGGPRKLCMGIIDAGVDLTWYCNARAEAITPKMADAMRQAGCHQVFMGFESGCNDMLKKMNKGETVSQLKRGAEVLKDAGIHISIGFIVGYPGETESSVMRTIELCNAVKPHRAQFTRFSPIPGSTAHKEFGTSANMGFHNREAEDQIESWLQKCYKECEFLPSL